MANTNEQEESLFEAAGKLTDPARRRAFLDAACADDLTMRQRIEDLFTAQADAERFFIEGASALEPAANVIVAATEKPGDRIGRYKLLQKIGEGGCGVVYVAEQQEPVRRSVALKVIKLGMDTHSVIARFEAERQALALMDHPNIAQVLDAGATDTGRPFFVMELVHGVKITDFCDQHHLSTRERLDLFVQVCQAIQHAHQKGIIHRDIKPSNILVTIKDAGSPGIPKVIDFGIAKATTDQPLTDKTIFTALEQFVGTPAYMSPEQASMTNLDVDTRSDIYSLGVLLYELLTRKTPFDADELLRAGLDEMRRTICETEPVRPSTRLSKALAATSSTRRDFESKIETLEPNIDRDLDWIVMKCLEKDRTRRYETANGLALDVQRHLNNEPVVACSPSTSYKVQKFVHRHQVGVTAGAIVAAVLVLGTVVSTWLAIRATHAQAIAKEKLRESYLVQAQAGRWSRRSGRRFNGLDALQKAADIGPGLDLRNEAIACLALPDLRAAKKWRDGASETNRIIFDSKFDRYARSDENGNISLRRVDDERELMHLPGFGSPASEICFSPDSQLLVVSYLLADRYSLYFWDLAQKKVLFKPAIKNFRTLSFAPDSSRIAIAQFNGPLVIYNLPSGQEARSFAPGPLPGCQAFDPQGRVLALSSEESSTVRLLDVETGQTNQSFLHPKEILSLAWSPRGNLLATGCADARIYIWDVVTGKTCFVLTGHQSAPIQLWFNHGGALLASNGWDGYLRLWNVATGNEICSRRLAGSLHGFSPDDHWLAADTDVCLFEIASGHECKLLKFDEKAGAGSEVCSFSPDGDVLASSHRDGVRFWETRTGTEIAFQPMEHIHSTVFHPSGKSVITSGSDGLKQWPIGLSREARATKVEIGAPRQFGPQGRLERASMAQQGNRVAVVQNGQVHVVDLEMDIERARLQGDPAFQSAGLSSNGKWCAAWSYWAKELSVFDAESGTLAHRLPIPRMRGAVFSPDNRWLATCNGEEYSFWRTDSWQATCSLRHETPIGLGTCISFSPDSRMAAIAFSVQVIRLVDPATGREFATLEGPEPQNISTTCFSPDGSKLAVTGWNQIIQLWDLRLIRKELKSMKLDWQLAP